MVNNVANDLYRHGGKKRNLPKFEKQYGNKKGKKVYGAVVGEQARKREAEKEQIHRELANPNVHPATKEELRKKLKSLER